MNERPTPETDAVAEAVGMGHFMVDSDFARKLERERDKSREDATNYYAKIGELEHELNNMQDQRDLAMKVTARLERERDEARNKMADALQEVDLRTLDYLRLREAIIATLEENRHLADGDDCTLAKLKSVVPEWK